MTPRSPKSPARKALPPIYVGVYDGCLVPYAWAIKRFTVFQVRQYGFKCDHVQKYIPAPVPPRSRKGGSR